MKIRYKLGWKAIKVTANMAIQISHANRQKAAKRVRADRLLAATPSEADPR